MSNIQRKDKREESSNFKGYSNRENSSPSNYQSPTPSRKSEIREQILQFTPKPNGTVVDKETYMKLYKQPMQLRKTE